MEKPAHTEVPIHPLLANRWSPRAFSPVPVESEKLHSVLEATRWAPSSANLQPWAYVIARRENEDEFSRMLGVLVPANQEWARNAGVLLLSVTQLAAPQTGKPNRFAFHDAGQANAFLVIQATALGLASHQMGGFNAEVARERLAIPPGWESVDVIALGYPAEPDSLPEKMRERELLPRSRKPLEQFVFAGTWGLPAAFAFPSTAGETPGEK